MMTRPRLLVVEDDALMGMLLAEMLGELGYDVCDIATTEADAVSSAARCKPDLMLVDATLGVGSGISAVDEVLRGGYIPHVFISGEVSRVSKFRPDAVVLQKPFRETELVNAIARALSRATLVGGCLTTEIASIHRGVVPPS
jgi:DNA-binding response OmpR family regulator